MAVLDEKREARSEVMDDIEHMKVKAKASCFNQLFVDSPSN